MGIKHGQDQVEGQKFGAHRVGLQIPLTGVGVAMLFDKKWTVDETTNLSVFNGFIVSLHNALKTRNASFTNRSSRVS